MNRIAVSALLLSVGICPWASGQGGMVTTNYGALPLSFEANAGQANASVKFLSRVGGYGLFLTADEAVLVREAPGSVLRMRLAGANSAAPPPLGEEQLPGTANYFIGSDPAQWRSGVPTYAKVRYRDVYPGVDLVYYGNQRQLEYDFVVAPGADPKPIRLRFAGAKGLRLGAAGDLAVTAAGGEVTLRKPAVYQVAGGRREPVEGSFALLAGNTVGFRLGSYDRAKTLVIDPVLAYSTYLGGSGGDSASAIAVDAAGNVYVAGSTTSTDFPVTQGSLQKTNGSPVYYGTAFVAKLNPAGTALLYSTYLGGSGSDRANGLAVDAFANLYIVGATSSSDFPVTKHAFQTAKPGSTNGFVCKLNPTGSALVYSTYLGGTSTSYEGGDSAAAVAVDGAGNAYVTGFTNSTTFPVTAGAFQTKNNAGLASNAFVTKLSPDGSALVYSTYLGGSGRIVFSFGPQVWDGDVAAAVALDSAGNAYVTGYAYSPDFPVTAEAFQTTNRALVPYAPGGVAASYNRYNAFITKLNPGGTALVYSTYLGGSGLAKYSGDHGNGMAVDAAGNAYIAGTTQSSDFPVTDGAFQATNHSAAGSNAFLAKLNPTGTALVYSTYLGGSATDAANGLAVDLSGNAYLAGSSTSIDFPVTQGALQTSNRGPGSGNAFLAELSASGGALTYSTYLGGSGTDSANGIVLDGFGSAYLAGSASSTDFPATAGAFQTANHSASQAANAFVAKVGFGTNLGAPIINPGGIVPLYSGVSTIQPGEWISIYGANLASGTGSANANNLTNLGGTSVTIDGKPGYLWYVSPTQINLQAPSDTAVGPVPVVVTTPGGTATSTVTLAQFGPAFSVLDGRHVAAVIPRSDGSGAYGGGTYDIAGPTGGSLGYRTVAAKAGEVLELYAVGLGPTNPAIAAGQAVSGVAPTIYPVTVQIGTVSVIPSFSGLMSQGLYQVNVTIPAGLGTGDLPLVATVGGAPTQTGVVLSVQ